MLLLGQDDVIVVDRRAGGAGDDLRGPFVPLRVSDVVPGRIAVASGGGALHRFVADVVAPLVVVDDLVAAGTKAELIEVIAAAADQQIVAAVARGIDRRR